MRYVLALVVAAACAHEAAAPVSDSPPPPPKPARLVVNDARPQREGPSLVEPLRERISTELAALHVPVQEDAALTVEISLLDISTKWGNGSPRSCVRFVGRVVRSGQAFVSSDTPSERCTSDERYGAFKDLKVLTELNDPKHAPTPETQLITEALDPLVVQLANRCR